MVNFSSFAPFTSTTVIADPASFPTASTPGAEIRWTVPCIVADVMARVKSLLETGHATEALRRLNAQRYACPAFDNARAVCMMRLGHPDAAVRVLQQLTQVTANGEFRSHVPVGYKVNLATALALTGEVDEAAAILAELRAADEHSLRASELQSALDRWQGGLSMWEQFQRNLGAHVQHAVILHFAPGELP
ncbi:tetratricopeptide repeat protein [Planctomicrobium piriforme]|uniref:Tetratricopeptide repeat-containing protein n=1 Tax=Planctomicrobium piriforme TaxID=1576369 RepID=A0A1I3PDZ1_9PLAN|nr:tetratricopeptide repeat protein [Planctomicrobium piriforme]SFJ19854.1 Tetratricopeptide repeat-containing protein [Planctomicrobium piriforme]